MTQNADSGRVIWNKETMHGPSVVPANADYAGTASYRVGTDQAIENALAIELVLTEEYDGEDAQLTARHIIEGLRWRGVQLVRETK